MSPDLPIRITCIDPEHQGVEQGWADLSSLLEDYSLPVARKLSQQLLDGQLVQQPLGDRLRVLSCPGDRREQLRQQIRDTFQAAGAEQLRGLSADQRVALAQRSGEPQLLARLAQDRRSRRVRVTVAANHHTGEEILVALADDPHPEVRQRAAMHPRLPPGLQGLLAEDPMAIVALALARRADLDPGAAQRLLAHPRRDVVLAVVHNPAAPEQLVRQHLQQLLVSEDVRDVKIAASSPLLGREQLERLAAGDTSGRRSWDTPAGVARSILAQMRS